MYIGVLIYILSVYAVVSKVLSDTYIIYQRVGSDGADARIT